jgi:hypothetical protein
MENQRWEGSEKRREEKKRDDQRRERVRRKKMQVRAKVGKSRNTCVSLEMSKKCTPWWREAHIEVKM